MATTRKTKAAKTRGVKHRAKRETVLLLRTCAPSGISYDGFRWLLKVGAKVEAPDWDPAPRCGGGLHGLLWGDGNGTLLDWSDSAKWLVVGAAKADVVEIDGDKAKCRRCVVRYVGDRLGATNYIREHGRGTAIVGGTSTSGDRGTSTSGNWGTSTSGDRGTSTSGYMGTSTSGNCGTSTSGYMGTSTSGSYGTSTSGYSGTSISGDYGTSTSGDRGIIVCRWYDAKASRYRLIVGYPGEDGIKPNTPYGCDERGKLVEVKK